LPNWQLGRLDEAEEHLGRAAALNPEVSRYRRQVDDLCAWRISCRTMLPEARETFRHDAPLGDLSLVLVPMGRHHALPLRRRQHPTIAQLTRLPHLRSTATARHWIEREGKRAGKLTLALSHPDYGLVGAVGLLRRKHAGLFYFWVAMDFQNRGFGTQAIRLLRAFALADGTEHLYSPVYQDNHRSRRVLDKLGFQMLPDTIETAEPGLHYFHLAVSADRANARAVNKLEDIQQLLSKHGAAQRLSSFAS